MAIYAHIWLYMDVYIYIYGYIWLYMLIYCILGVWICIFDVWTCIWVSALDFWVFGLVLGCLHLYFGRLDLYSGYCIPVGCLYTCRMWLWRARSHPPWSMILPQALFFFWKMTPLFCLSTYFVDFVDFHWFEALLVFLSKSGQSDQMTMPARRASKFSAKRRAVLLLIIFQSLISHSIPWIIEHWPECQPELCYIWRWWSLEITRPCRTILFRHRFVFT